MNGKSNGQENGQCFDVVKGISNRLDLKAMLVFRVL